MFSSCCNSWNCQFCIATSFQKATDLIIRWAEKYSYVIVVHEWMINVGNSLFRKLTRCRRPAYSLAARSYNTNSIHYTFYYWMLSLPKNSGLSRSTMIHVFQVLSCQKTFINKINYKILQRNECKNWNARKSLLNNFVLISFHRGVHF